MTDHNKVGAYMGQLNNASFLESKLNVMLKEAINAEIVLGNVTSQKEAFDWINHTFFSIRIRRNPYNYDCRVVDVVNKDLIVEIHISDLIESTLKDLDKLRLIRFDRKSGYLSSTDLGRICSHYYV
jgi:replicative superfamily II helicase